MISTTLFVSEILNFDFKICVSHVPDRGDF